MTTIGGTSVAVKGDQLAVAYEGATNGLAGVTLAQLANTGAMPQEVV